MAVDTSGMNWNEVLFRAAAAYLNGTGDDPPTLANIEALLESIDTTLSTPATELPPQVPVGAGNAEFSRDDVNLSAVSGDQTLVAAVASQSTRVHGLFLTISGAAAETLVTVKAGATAIGFLRVPATPNQLVVDRRDVQYWLYKTGNNEAFILSPAAAVNIAGDILFQTSA